LVKAVQKKGYRQPTPIQRKAIPLLLEGKDVLGMARTGSGKTAAFVLPMLQRLRCHSAKTGIRALILAPSRELALQTFKVAQQLARGSGDLRLAAVVGGDGLEEQFASMATNPDVVVATPGRLLHVCVEARLNLKTVEMVVWDEADRLLEDASMGEQLAEIMARCPASRQTALFSATLPKALADFARAGLTSPHLLRLDAEGQLSPDLRSVFLSTTSDTRDAHLVALLGTIAASPTPQQTVVFAATKHHVEYLQELLGAFGFACAYIYGTLDQAAREEAIEAFRQRRRSILVVTDVASRGIDVPLLDVVVNYDFPASPKLFVHRVGRVARAGRKGTAYSLVAPDELPFLLDLQLFLGQPLVVAGSQDAPSGDAALVLGTMPRDLLDMEHERVCAQVALNGTLEALQKVVMNAYKLYKKTRLAASPESHRRAKELMCEHPLIGVHPEFASAADGGAAALRMLSSIRAFKPKVSFLELSNAKASKAAPVQGKASRTTRKADNQSFRDETHFLGYRPERNPAPTEERELAFNRQANDALLEISGMRRRDELIKTGSQLASKLKRRLAEGRSTKRIKTEHGHSLPASYQNGDYDKWCARTRLQIQKPGETESSDLAQRATSIVSAGQASRKFRKNTKAVKASKARKSKK
jgi:ATP-dependent RNA helicase DDX54/DBP10